MKIKEYHKQELWAHLVGINQKDINLLEGLSSLPVWTENDVKEENNQWAWIGIKTVGAPWMKTEYMLLPKANCVLTKVGLQKT